MEWVAGLGPCGVGDVPLVWRIYCTLFCIWMAFLVFSFYVSYCLNV
jgi:hypothetical protein